jgi:DNA-binding response OmpR family regulator
MTTSISMGLEMNLAAEGYERAQLAGDGEAGPAPRQVALPFDLLILDVMLPKLNGFEVLRKHAPGPPLHPGDDAQLSARAPRWTR